MDAIAVVVAVEVAENGVIVAGGGAVAVEEVTCVVDLVVLDGDVVGFVDVEGDEAGAFDVVVFFSG